jgi:hypothetical protein
VLLAVLHGDVGEADVRRLVIEDRRAADRREPARAGEVIGLLDSRKIMGGPPGTRGYARRLYKVQSRVLITAIRSALCNTLAAALGAA